MVEAVDMDEDEASANDIQAEAAFQAILNGEESAGEQLEWDGDNGIVNMVGMYIKHPDKSFCDYFRSLQQGTKSTEQDDNEKDTPEKVTPRRGAMRKWAHEQMSKAATRRML